MLFNSVQFLFFFPIVTLLYFLLPQSWRVYFLVVASCLFYMAFIPAYILILFLVILIDFTAGFLIHRSVGGRRRLWLGMSLVANIGLLAIFKYFNFANHNLAYLAQLLDWNYPIPDLGLILPLGLSFHTFQAMSYTIEVYRGNREPEHSLPHYMLYVLFYPQLVAGPIERPQNLLHQFRERHTFDYARVTDGLKLMAWGMFKKVAIADQLAGVVNAVYAAPASFDGVGHTIATVFFAFQIYCDFSGYSDIALGAAQVMGFRLMKNFRQPYHARSIGEFWKRWHISLSSWFKDYLYISLGGNRFGFGRMCFNVFAVFLVSGLWHGANWTFIIWGALHGTYRVTEILCEKHGVNPLAWVGISRVPLLYHAVTRLYVFVLVGIGWVFFRASSVDDAWYVLSHMYTGWSAIANWSAFAAKLNGFGLTAERLGLAVVLLAVLLATDILQDLGALRPRIAAQPAWVRWGLYYAVLVALLSLGVFTQNTFIYFQF